MRVPAMRRGRASRSEACPQHEMNVTKPAQAMELSRLFQCRTDSRDARAGGEESDDHSGLAR